MTQARDPHPHLDKERAEGSRHTVDEALERDAGGGDAPPADAGPAGDPEAPGITNRPQGEEQQEQAGVPPRGQRKPPR